MEALGTKKEWRNKILGRVVVFSFVKRTDGSIRRMIGTHNTEIIPKEKKRFSNKKTQVKDLSIVKIFDLEYSEWRSFDINSLIEIEYMLSQEEYERIGSDWVLEKFELESECLKLMKLRKVINGQLRSKRRKIKNRG